MSGGDWQDSTGDAGRAVQTAWQLAQEQQPEQALAILQDLLNRNPRNADAWIVAGNILQHYGEFTQASDAYRRVLEILPGDASAAQSLSITLMITGALDEAEQLIAARLQREPNSPDAWASLAVLRQKQVHTHEAIEAFRRSLALQPNPIHHSNLLQLYQYVDGVSAEQLLAAHREWDQAHGAPRLAPASIRALEAGRPLRLGFLSADFGRHPMGYLGLSPIEHLDRSRCTVTCYYDRLPEDDYTARFRAASDHWRVTATINDADLAAQIRADEIDVLVDLMGHTGMRMQALARRLAPIQMTWLGYVGTTGLANMDYLLADRFHVAPGDESFYSENILRLPHDYICFGPPDEAPDVGPLPALTTGHVTFGSFNNAAKLSPSILDAWAQILLRVPQSQLLIKNRALEQPKFRDALHVHFAQHGIPPQRVILEAGTPPGGILAEYARVDIALDTQPYSGGLTTCEALWMGVPVITFPGKSFAGRHSTSHLANAGLPQLVAADIAGYIDLAVHWSQQSRALAALRSQMREQVRRSQLCNAQQFANDLLALLYECAAFPR